MDDEEEGGGGGKRGQVNGSELPEVFFSSGRWRNYYWMEII